MLLTALVLGLADAPCRSLDTALPRDLAGWRRNGRTLDTGRAVMLPVRRGEVQVPLRIRKAGIFGIAADQPGWIDVAPPRARALDMARESHGPRCSTIRKIVYYRLRPGNYRVTVARLKANRVKLMLVHD